MVQYKTTGQDLDTGIAEFAELLYAFRMALGIKAIKANIFSFLLSNHLIKAHEMGGDGLWCPRCGDIFHESDMSEKPEDYYTCPECFAIQHEKCRNLSARIWNEDGASGIATGANKPR